MRIEGQLDIGAARAAESGSARGAPKDEFLRLLVAQLRHQNPLEPQDGAAFVAQLAQFASLEQMTETNGRLASLEAGQSSQLRAGFSDLVGKRVTVAGDRVKLPFVDGLSHGFELDGPAKSSELVVYDESGNEVRRMELGPKAKGRHTFAWDGLGAEGQALPPGEYRFEVQAKGTGGESLRSTMLFHAVIDGVDFTGGSVRFRMGERTMSPSDILSIDS